MVSGRRLDDPPHAVDIVRDHTRRICHEYCERKRWQQLCRESRVCTYDSESNRSIEISINRPLSRASVYDERPVSFADWRPAALGPRKSQSHSAVPTTLILRNKTRRVCPPLI